MADLSADAALKQAALTGFTNGFEGYYRPTQDEWRRAYAHAWIVLDTNALLDLYRLSPAARRDLFSVYEAVRDRIFVPHHVAAEFHNRRIDAVQSRREEFEQAKEQLSEQERKAKAVVRRVSHRAGEEDAKEVEDAIETAFRVALEFVSDTANEYDLDPDRLTSGSDDEVLARLGTLLAGRVADKPSDEELLTDIAEAKRRTTEGIPPGYKDAGKDVNASGDYLWWAEVVRFATDSGRPVLLVSNDVGKGDWTLDRRGFRIGPHPILVDEMRAASGAQLLLSTTSDLLRRAGEFLGIQVSDRTVAESKTLPDHADTLEGGAPHQFVPAHWVPVLVPMTLSEYQLWAARDWIPDVGRSKPWRWPDVRRAAMIHELTVMDCDLSQIGMAVSALESRPPAHTQLVLQRDRYVWLKRHNLEAFLQDADSEPGLVLDWGRIEKKLRIVQASLARSNDMPGNDSDALSTGNGSTAR